MSWRNAAQLLGGIGRYTRQETRFCRQALLRGALPPHESPCAEKVSLGSSADIDPPLWLDQVNSELANRPYQDSLRAFALFHSGSSSDHCRTRVPLFAA